MRTWNIIAATIMLLLIASLAGAQTTVDNILANYSFDDNALTTGPDTFAIFKHAKGTVSLSTAYRYSGYRSIEVRDIAGDGDFPELQGYFPLRQQGRIFIHFSFLITDVKEGFNIALAGPAHFNLHKDGIGFWLKMNEGALFQCNETKFNKLFVPTAFVWYSVDADYDIDRGSYDLTIRAENQKSPIISLTAQQNAVGVANSALDKYSFIGDLDDESNAVYYVDDILLLTDKPVASSPFVAPGRRKLFIDRWQDYYRLLHSQPTAIPAVDFSDFGINPAKLQQLMHENLSQALNAALSGAELPVEILQHTSQENAQLLRAIELWQRGNRALARGEAQLALKRYDEAAQRVPAGKIYRLASIMALAGLKRWTEADLRIAAIYGEWFNDARFAAALAMIGIARGNLSEAQNLLEEPAEKIVSEQQQHLFNRLWTEQLNQPLIDEIKRAFPKSWLRYLEERLISEQYYFVLLWQNNFQQAEQYATRMVAREARLKLPTARWYEFAGDALFLAENYQGALQWYQQSLKQPQSDPYLYLRLSDVYYQLGDLEQERYYRERIYGNLHE